jgi:hypothetical protein
MKKAGSVTRYFFASTCMLNLVSLPGCGDNVARTAPEAVVKAKKEDIAKAESERFAQEAASKGNTTRKAR